MKWLTRCRRSLGEGGGFYATGDPLDFARAGGCQGPQEVDPGLNLSLCTIITLCIHDEMTSTSNTTGSQHAASWTPSMRSLPHRWSAISNAEEGNNAAADEAQQAISEEIDEIKRYEVGHNGLYGC